MSIQVGRVTLNEAVLRAFEEQWGSDGRGVGLSGIMFSDPTQPRARMASLHDDLLGLPLSLVPVLFGVKSHRNGYYRVESSTSSIVELDDQALIQLSWAINLVRLGNDSEVDLESRLAGPATRTNNFSVIGERWHAAPVGHSSYWVGSSTPGQVSRTGSDGALSVYRSLPAATNPQWHCPVENYHLGRSRILDPYERAGTGVELSSGWVISNSLLTFGPAGNGFDLRVFAGGSLGGVKRFNLTLNGTALGVPVAVSVLHNEYERVTVRCLWNRSPSGRVYADITLRRGSRYLEIVLRSNSSAILGVVRGSNEASTSGAGFIRATSNDSDGNRFMLASLKTFTGDLTAGGISLASTTVLDFIIGSEVAGSAAVAGDQAANLLAQYVGTPSEVVQAVRR